MEFENRQFLLVARPAGRIPQQSDWKLVTTKISEDSLKENQVLVKTECLSVDPAQRIWMERDSYTTAIPLNSVMRGHGIGKVIKSNDQNFAVGDHVSGFLCWQDYSIHDGKTLQIVQKGTEPAKMPLEYYVTFVTALTGYFGLTEVGKVKEGDSVLISAAAGATGIAAGQIAKLLGCKVVGIAGSDEKCKMITTELGFDGAINYKTTQDLLAEINNHFPNGVDVYFDNVGGKTLDAALVAMKNFGRVVCCGAISVYNNDLDKGDIEGIKNYVHIVTKRLKLEGFIVSDFLPKWGEARSKLVEWMTSGKDRKSVV